MTTNYMELFLTPVSFVLIPGPVVTAGLGELAVVCQEGASPVVGSVTSATKTTEVDTLETDGVIDAAGARQARAALSQGYKPSRVYIGTHTGAQTPADALDALVLAEIDFGPFAIANVTDAGISAVGTWLATDGRALQYFAFAETRTASALTATKPPTLTTFASTNSTLLRYGAVDQGLAGAIAGQFSGKGLADGPAATTVQITGVALPVPTLSGAEVGFALANDIGILMPLDVGSSAADLVVRGAGTYGGVVGFTPWTGILFTLRRARAGITALVRARALTAVPLLTTVKDRADAAAAITEQLNPLAAAGHYVFGTSGEVPNEVTLPVGFRVTTRKEGTSITADILVRVGEEAETFSISGIGSVA